MDPSDFPIGAEPAQGLDGLASNPWTWITALILGLLIFYLGTQWGKVKAEEKGRAALKKNLEAIHKAIKDKARAAAAAPWPQVMPGAQALLNDLEGMLKPVAELAPLGTHTKALSSQLRPDQGHDGHGHSDHGHGDHGRGGDAAHAATDKAKAASAAAAASNIHITIGDVSQGASAHAGGHSPAHGTDISAIRAAVLAFTDYWSRPTMVAELMAAQRALVHPMPHAPPKPVSKPASSH